MNKAKDWNESCIDDQQCNYKSNKGMAGCVNDRCGCKQGYTLCSFPQNLKMCRKIGKTLDITN